MAVFFFDTFRKVTTPYLTAELRLRCIYETKRIETDHLCNVLYGDANADGKSVLSANQAIGVYNADRRQV